MEAHVNLSDLEFEQQFKSCTLNPELFTHEAHLRLAYIHINKYGVKDAGFNITSQLKAFVNHLGASEKYNATLTIAAIKAVYHFILKSKSNDFSSFILEFPRLKSSFKDLMTSHYSIDIFNLDKAKIEFIKPDVLPFD
ncbi:hypothetical protein FBALC1_04257 [Flavobacteriales bacterium ALC-1]|nr:hypothetical protein FBALC1_04257 [Flavobacteriales bacterium ALC-1]